MACKRSGVRLPLAPPVLSPANTLNLLTLELSRSFSGLAAVETDPTSVFPLILAVLAGYPETVSEAGFADPLF